MRSSGLIFIALLLVGLSACGPSFSASPFSDQGPASGGGAVAPAGGSDAVGGSGDAGGGRGGESSFGGVSGQAGSSGMAAVSAGTSNIGFSGTGGSGPGGSGPGGTGGSGSAGTGGSMAGAGGVPACLDVLASDANCGACGYACVNGRHCAAGRCLPAWQPLSIDGQPDPRTRHAAAVARGKYVVLGGTPVLGGVGTDSVAVYDPVTNSWSAAPSLNSARCAHDAVSTGSTVLTFGGLSDCGNGTTTTPGLESFDPGTPNDGWSAIVAAGEPEHRYNFAAIWTGSGLFVYGGGTNMASAVASGGFFTPSMASWADASCSLPGCARGWVYAFRDGGVVHVWGDGPDSAGLTYDLVGRFWSNTSWTVPSGTTGHLAGRFADDGRRIFFLKGTNVVSIYDRKTSGWLANDVAVMPNGFCTEAAAAWAGSELIAWSGSCGGSVPVSVGGRYQPVAPD
jgi:hypothetical protein